MLRCRETEWDHEEREVWGPGLGSGLRRGPSALLPVDSTPYRPPIKPLATFTTAPNILLAE